MKQSRLSGPVSVTGRSFLGCCSTCVLEPTLSGIHMKLPSGRVVPLSSMHLETRGILHSLVLRCQGFALRIPEHLLGLIFALGLDGVLIAPENFRLPYNGTAEPYWNAVEPAHRDAGNLTWYTPPESFEVVISRERWVQFLPAKPGCRSLRYEISVGYPELGEMTIRGVVGEKTHHDQLFTARPYSSRSHMAIAGIARKCGWPHGDIGVRPAPKSAREREGVLEETCWHRQLDLLGAFMTLCPPGSRIAGTILSHRAGHVLDVELVKKMLAMRKKWVRV